MVRSFPSIDDPHDHLCLHCGRWWRVVTEDSTCPFCFYVNPPIHSAAQLMGHWGLNVFLEDAGVSEGLVDPGWSVRLLPGKAPTDLVLDVAWTAADAAPVQRLLKRFAAAIALDPIPVYRRRQLPGGTVWATEERYSLTEVSHPVGLYRLVTIRIALILAVFLSLTDALIGGAKRPRPPQALGWAAEWLARFLAAPPLLDANRLVERFCLRCLHDQTGFYEPMCSFFRDDPLLAWGSGSEPWYDAMLAASAALTTDEDRKLFLAGPDGALPPVPVSGSPQAFALVGRVLAHFRPRRCLGFVAKPSFEAAIGEWADGALSMVEVAEAMLDPLLVKVVGDNLPTVIADVFEGAVNPTERRVRRPSEVAVAATRLLNLAEWVSASALDRSRR